MAQRMTSTMSVANAGTPNSLHIDWTACDGRGLCAELLPEILTADDWGYPLARNGNGGDIPEPPQSLPYARRAVKQCPRLALRLHQPPAEGTTAPRTAPRP